MKFKRFQIWLADLNPRVGTETGKVRPVVIIQTNLLNKTHPSVIVCPITSKTRNNVSILRVNTNNEQNGLKKPSAIMIDQIRAIDGKRLIKKLGSIDEDLQQKIIDNIKIVLDM